MSVHENNKARQPEAIQAPPVALQRARSINISKASSCTKWSLLMIGVIRVMLGIFAYFCPQLFGRSLSRLRDVLHDYQ